MHRMYSSSNFLSSCKWLFVLSVLITVNLILYLVVDMQVRTNNREVVLRPLLSLGNATSSNREAREQLKVQEEAEDEQTGSNSETDPGNSVLGCCGSYVDNLICTECVCQHASVEECMHILHSV